MSWGCFGLVLGLVSLQENISALPSLRRTIYTVNDTEYIWRVVDHDSVTSPFKFIYSTVLYTAVFKQ